MPGKTSSTYCLNFSAVLFFTSAVVGTAVIAAGVPGSTLFGPVPAEKYLAGDYRADRHPDFVKLTGIDQGNPERKHWLRTDVAGALYKMEQAFKKQHPEIPFRIASTTRSFSYQQRIWDKKWQHYNTITDSQERLHKVLEFSALPGASRHHWGTEFDLWPLNNEYYRKGHGRILYNWLAQRAAGFGFCQPYTAGRNSGHKEERWHWSYKPMSKLFYDRWLDVYSGADKKVKQIKYISKYSSAASLYIKSISSHCK